MLQRVEGPTHYCYGATAPGVLPWKPAAFHFSWCVTPFLPGTRSVQGTPTLTRVLVMLPLSVYKWCKRQEITWPHFDWVHAQHVNFESMTCLECLFCRFGP